MDSLFRCQLRAKLRYSILRVEGVALKNVVLHLALWAQDRTRPGEGQWGHLLRLLGFSLSTSPGRTTIREAA